MKEIKVSVNTWYVVEGTAGATVINPSTNKAIATVEDGKQTAFFATTPYVLVSDDSVNVFKATFNSAPAKLRLLGLLGGGAQTLPAGYIPAEFLEATTAGTRITFPAQLSSAGHKIEIKTEHYISPGTGFQAEGSEYLAWGCYQTNLYYKSQQGWTKGSIQPNAWNVIHCIFENSIITAIQGDEFFERDKGIAESSNLVMFFEPSFKQALLGKKRYLNITVDGKAVRQFVPALAPEGEPCMYDKVNKETFTNSGPGSFVVGMTCKQALKLAELPSTGGTLTISLPTNWQEDEGVVNALATAEANGWVFTYQTYEADASTASTFALRRIFVRKTQNENGQYEAADGSRWHVEWCAGMIGAEPTDHGYEPFRNVDAAVAYWELEPYVDPEQEELLTAYNENEQ